MPRFAHLHLHTEYSILDGACRIPDACELAKEMGMDSLAITDHGVMYGAFVFYQKARDMGLNPIIGCEVYVAPGGRASREGGLEGQPSHLVLLAENNTGYQNLMQLVTRGFTEGFYYKPRVDRELLERYSEGLIALSACLKGEVARALLSGDESGAARTAEDYARIFGEGNFFIELMDHGIPEQARVNPMLVELARTKGLGLVATNDIHYVRREDAGPHDYMLCIQTGSLLADERRLKFSSDDFYLKSPDEMAGIFPDFPEALDNTADIAGRCNVEIPEGRILLPRYTPPPGFDFDSYLEHLAAEGVRSRYPDEPPEVMERLRVELDTIKQLGFSGYFLIVWDFVKYAKERGIRVGPGRGSAAGSLVAYAMGITTIDPLKYGLLFERFLNPERIALPDIDIDFSHLRRPEVIEYVAQKYGRDRVAQIISFSRLNARAAVKDVGRVMDVEFAKVDNISKMIPEDPNMTIDLALQQSSDLRLSYEEDREVREIIDTARSLEGLVRHDTIHAAGVVIADEELASYMPLQRKGGEDAEVVTQYDMYDIEKLGLLKVDFLGLKNQSLIELAVELINGRHEDGLDIDNIPMDDADTFRLIQSGRTVGTFQLASSGMRTLMRDMMPSRFEDIIALIALYRPGPLKANMHRVFIDNKAGREPVSYPHPSIKEVLEETHGVIVYQEQAMRIATVLAGYSGKEADELRKAMAKKKPEIMLAHRQKFLEGASALDIDAATATRVFDLIEKFGGYGFNKSHSAAYAFVSYQTAYLKAHYPSEYMAALMTIYMNDQDRLVEYINECRRMGLTVRPPDINLSDGHFTPYDDNVLFGLSAVRNVGAGVVELIIAARDEGGPFASMADYCERVPASATNKKTLESLIKAGAFDSVEPDRSRLLSTFDSAVTTAQRKRREREAGQFSLFGDEGSDDGTLGVALPSDYEEIPRRHLLGYEKEMLGVYVSDHPLTEWKDLLCQRVEIELAQITGDMDRASITVGGMIANLERRSTKAGKAYASFVLEDFSGSAECLVFSNKLEKLEPFLHDDAIVLVKARVDMKENTRKLLADEVTPLQKVFVRPARLVLRIEADRFTEELTSHIKEILLQHPGDIPVHFSIFDDGQEVHAVRLGDLYSVETVSDLMAKLKALLGSAAIKVEYPD